MRAVGARDAIETTIKLLTYNVLAQCYVRSSFFPYCEPSILRWKNRSKKLARVIEHCAVRPQVICLQEVDNFDEFWSPIMRGLGYSGVYVQKTQRKKDGVAVFWQEGAIEMMQYETVSLDAPVGDESDCSEDLLERAQRGNVGVITMLRTTTATPTTFLVATSHLFWDPAQADVKLLQVKRMLGRVQAFQAAQPKVVPLIYAGDFNSLPDSEVYRCILDQHGFRSAYALYAPGMTPTGEPEFTNVNGVSTDAYDMAVPKFLGTLDYIFFQPSQLRVVALLELMSKEQATKEKALPSTFSPSDHLPLLCELAFT